MSADWYPLSFAPIELPKPWGGSLLRTTLNRPTPAGEMPIGISCELIDNDDGSNVCENGPLAGQTLRQLIEDYPEEMIGPRQYPDAPCPLRIQYFDVGRQLPLEVHAADAQGGPIAKFWYVMTSARGGRIQVGFTARATRQQFVSRYGTPQLAGQLEQFPSSLGDAYYITPGRVNAIGPGNLVFSVEQAVTDSRVIGPLEPSRTVTLPDDELLGMIDFTDRSIARIRADGSPTLRNRKLPLIANCPAFSVDELRITEKHFDRGDGRTFHYLSAVSGPVLVESNGAELVVELGRGCFLPAGLTGYSVTPIGDVASVLRVALRRV